MGYPYHELIPPAILIDHPGITKEEFVQRLSEAEYSDFSRYTKDDPWDVHTPNTDSPYKKGVAGLSDILHLGESEQFKRFKQPRRDVFGIPLRAPEVMPVLKSDFAKGITAIKYKITTHHRNEPGAHFDVSCENGNWVRVGDVTEVRIDDSWATQPALITEVNSLDFSPEIVYNQAELFKEPVDPETIPSLAWNWSARVRPFKPVESEQVVDTEEEVWATVPEYHPLFRFNFDQQQGHFYISRSDYKNKPFRWMNNDGKYYLDPKSFELMTEGYGATYEFGYTDLVLTAEAIRLKAWKLFSNRGRMHLPQLFEEFPDTKKRYESAVINAWMSGNEKRRLESGKLDSPMTNAEFMRTKLTHGRGLI